MKHDADAFIVIPLAESPVVAPGRFAYSVVPSVSKQYVPAAGVPVIASVASAEKRPPAKLQVLVPDAPSNMVMVVVPPPVALHSKSVG